MISKQIIGSTRLPDPSGEVSRLVANSKGLAAHPIVGMRNEFGMP